MKNKKHPELWSLSIDKTRWIDKFIHPQMRVKDWDGIITEAKEKSDIWTFPVFTKEFCEMIIEEAEHQDVWVTDRHSNYPTTDFPLKEIGLHEVYDFVLKEYVFPCVRYIWGLTGDEWGKNMWHDTFVAKYSPEAQGHLSSHLDASNYSVTLALNDGFTGGGTWYNRQQVLIKAPIGYMCLFPMPTHKHSGRWIDTGVRYIIVSFCRCGSDNWG